MNYKGKKSTYYRHRPPLSSALYFAKKEFALLSTSSIAFLLIALFSFPHETIQAQTSTIGDFVWIDTDGDGIQDASEPGLADVTVELYDDANQDGVPDGSVVASTISGSNGYYQLSGVSYGSYVLKFTPPSGYDYTSQNSGGETKDSDADPSTGLTSTFTIGESYWAETSDGLSEGCLWGEVCWEYTSYNNEGEAITADVSGDGLDSVIVKGGPSEVTYTEPPFTDLTAPEKNNGKGYYGISHLEFYYTYVDVTGLDAGFEKTTLLQGNLWFDYNSDGVMELSSNSEYSLDQWTVELYDNSGNLVGTTSTASDGSYYFEDFGSGTYTVEVSAPAGYEGTYDPDGVSTSDASTFTIASNQHIADYNFGYYGTSATSGVIWEDTDFDGIFDPDETGLSGWTVTVESAEGNFTTTLTTNSDGTYNFDHLAPGDYTVSVEAPADYSQTYDENGTETPNQTSVSLSPGENFNSSDFGYVESQTLPVKWLQFSAEYSSQQNEVVLRWTTVEDEYSDQYTVQRSKEGHIWNSIGTIKIDPQTQRSITSSYRWIDEDPLQGTAYYRIMQTDVDGTYNYSVIRLIQRSSSSSEIRVYPNPASKTLHVALPDNELMHAVELYDFSGQFIKEVKHQSELVIQEIPEGFYMLIIRDASGSLVHQTKVLIRR